MTTSSTGSRSRESCNPDCFEEIATSLRGLYRLMGAAPVGQRVFHDGTSAINVPDGSWQTRRQALWDLPVPSVGAAQTVQGEAIRVTGRLSNKILGNGGVNWDRDFRSTLGAGGSHLEQGDSLDEGELGEVASLERVLRSGSGESEQLYRLGELAVD
ncbi:hypothetical protein [Arthrobacter sp. PAMC 25486]|uniref:hypothetical protein n=1 Tax=Arthrobacter sp. PAMC 25486 TaxID=1494608 RepID=UPI0012FF3D19|nr:hypothetical protein [Arthrobacter sp. PAMC 25486]